MSAEPTDIVMMAQPATVPSDEPPHPLGKFDFYLRKLVGFNNDGKLELYDQMPIFVKIKIFEMAIAIFSDEEMKQCVKDSNPKGCLDRIEKMVPVPDSLRANEMVTRIELEPEKQKQVQQICLKLVEVTGLIIEELSKMQVQ